MKREIKFRGMCANGIMRYGRLSQDALNSTAYYDTFSQRICWNEGTRHSNIPVSNDSLGQYTGLKDNNGKEIYEGDIVKASSEEYFPFISEVKFDGGSFILVHNHKEPITLFELHTLYTQLEIIGNIYENPELLEGE